MMTIPLRTIILIPVVFTFTMMLTGCSYLFLRAPEVPEEAIRTKRSPDQVCQPASVAPTADLLAAFGFGFASLFSGSLVDDGISSQADGVSGTTVVFGTFALGTASSAIYGGVLRRDCLKLREFWQTNHAPSKLVSQEK